MAQNKLDDGVAGARFQPTVERRAHKAARQNTGDPMDKHTAGNFDASMASRAAPVGSSGACAAQRLPAWRLKVKAAAA
jgi:hypothetical protein